MANESNKMNLEQAINSLSRAIQLYRYYGRGHQVTTESIETLYKNLDEILDVAERWNLIGPGRIITGFGAGG